MGQETSQTGMQNGTPSSGASNFGFSGFGGVNGQSMMNQSNPVGAMPPPQVSMQSPFGGSNQRWGNPMQSMGLGGLEPAAMQWRGQRMYPGDNLPANWGGEQQYMNPVQQQQMHDTQMQRMSQFQNFQQQQNYADQQQPGVMPWQSPYY